MTINPETVSFPLFPSGKSSFSPVSLILLHPGKEALQLPVPLPAVPRPRPSSHTGVLAWERPAPQVPSVHPACTPTSSTGPRAWLLLPGQTPETLADPPHRDNPSFLSAHLSIIQGSNYDYRKER